MAAKEPHAGDKLFCTICTEPISDDRILKSAATCSPRCSKQLKNIRRRKRDLKKCRYCNQPSTPEERRDYNQWRAEKGLKKKPGRPKKAVVSAAEPPAQMEITDMMHV